jgi:flagellar hook capping protein FlgD
MGRVRDGPSCARAVDSFREGITVQHIFKTARRAGWLAIVLCWLPVGAWAGPYTQLQVLLPGENPAPGTSSGKVGTPYAQTVSVPFSVRVRACDANWNTVTTISDVVALSSTDQSAILAGPATLDSGEHVFSMTFNAQGSFTVSADDQTDLTIPNGVSALVASTALHGFEFARINQKNQYAGTAMGITFRAVDASGQTVSGFSGPVDLHEFTSFGEGRITPATVNLSGGTWTGNVTLYRADETAINRGNVNIFAQLGSDATKNGTSDPFTVHPGTYAKVEIVLPGETAIPGSVSGVTGSPATQGAGQAFTVNVFATDAYWNQVPSGDQVRITSSDPLASTPVTGTLTNGFRAFSLSLGTVGTQTLTVTDLTNGSIQSMTSAGIPVIPSGAARFVIETLPSPVTAGSQVAVTVHAADQSGNTIPTFSGQAILTANTGPGSIYPEAITFTNGTWTGNVLFKGAGGSVTVTCADYSSPPHTGTSNAIQVLPGPLAQLQVLLPGQTAEGGTQAGFTGTPTDQNAGASFTLTVRAVDAYWNLVPGINHRIALTSTDGFAGIPAETTLTNGQRVMPAILYKGGLQTITATDLDDSNVTAHTSSQVRVVSGPYARILILCPGESLAPGTLDGRTGGATDQSINFAFTVSVYATDNWWNPVGGVTDLVHLTSTDPLAQLPPDTPMADGRADLAVRLSTGGYQQITVHNLTRPSMPTSTTQVRAISSGFHLEADVAPTDIGAGENFSLTVKITNDAGSVIQEMNSSVTVEVQNASSRQPGQGTLLTTQFQLLQGQRTVTETYTFVEPIVLVIHDDAGNTPAVSAVVNVHPGQPAAIRLACDPTWLHGNKHGLVTARVVDAYENGVPGQPVTFTLLAGTGVLTPNGTDTDDTGAVTADFLSPRNPEVGRIRATSNAIVQELDIQTAFVDPSAAGGTITNYPNPFHPGEAPTTIAYVLNDNATVTMTVHTLAGGLVLERTYATGTQGGRQGLNEVTWDGRNGDGDYVASGGYILDVQAQGGGETLHHMRRKIAVVR